VITFDDGYKDNYIYAYPILKKYDVPATIFLATGYIDNKKVFWTTKLKYALGKTNLEEIEVEGIGRYPLRSIEDRGNSLYLIIKKLKTLPEEEKCRIVDKLLTLLNVELPHHLFVDRMLSWQEIREMSEDGIDFGAHTVNHPILTNISLSEAEREIVQSKKEIEEKISKEVRHFAYPNGEFNDDIINLVKKSGFLSAVTTIHRLLPPLPYPYKLERIGPFGSLRKVKFHLSGLYQDLRRIIGGDNI
jgi:hypothetical protein